MRRPVVGVLVFTVASACSIEFVALEDEDVSMAVDVRSEHTDQLRTQVRIRQRGGLPSSVGVDGEVVLGERDSTGSYAFDVELEVDPSTPVLNVRVDQTPISRVSLDVALLAKAGEPICAADGSLTVPVRFERALLPELTKSWQVQLSDAEGQPLTAIRALGDLPDPLVVAAGLVPVTAAFVAVEATASGPVEGVVWPMSMRVASEAVWSLTVPCPS